MVLTSSFSEKGQFGNLIFHNILKIEQTILFVNPTQINGKKEKMLVR